MKKLVCGGVLVGFGLALGACGVNAPDPTQQTTDGDSSTVQGGKCIQTVLCIQGDYFNVHKCKCEPNPT